MRFLEFGSGLLSNELMMRDFCQKEQSWLSKDGVLGKLFFIFKTYYKARQCVITLHKSSAYYNLRQLGYYNSRQLLLQFTTDITIHGIITIRLRHVGPAVVLRWETCGKRVKKTKVSSNVNCSCYIFLLYQRALCREI